MDKNRSTLHEYTLQYGVVNPSLRKTSDFVCIIFVISLSLVGDLHVKVVDVTKMVAFSHLNVVGAHPCHHPGSCSCNS